MTREAKRAVRLAAGVAIAALALAPAAAWAASFDDDVSFMKEHIEILTLSSEDGQALVAVSPAYQGRVMTSSAAGPDGLSFGWINRPEIASGEVKPHMNAYGGEDRFWLGPEGGQYSIFFPKGAPFEFAHWQTPPPIDCEPFETVRADAERCVFKRRFQLENYSGYAFDLEVNRKVQLVRARKAMKELGAEWDNSLKAVGFRSVNTIVNKGDAAWEKETGLLSIWILSMFSPSPRTTIVVPFKPGPETELGPVVNDAYFGSIAPDRLKIGDGILFFRADGKSRGKIGLSHRRTKAIAGSYAADLQVLTLASFSFDPEAADYVNSLWEIQDDPYGGDVFNSYNDGPVEPAGKPLGPFYELESSSPAAALAPGESMRHVHSVFHFQGPEKALDALARKTLGAGLKDIAAAFE